MEEDPAKHVHPMGKRIPQDDWQKHFQFGDGPVRRIETDCSNRGVVTEAHEQAQQATHISQPKARKCLRGSKVSGGGGNQNCKYWWVLIKIKFKAFISAYRIFSFL